MAELRIYNGSTWVAVTDELHRAAADPHTQYVLGDGRSPGQHIYGGDAAGDDITIESTSDGTKGDIILTGPTVVVGNTSGLTANGELTIGSYSDADASVVSLYRDDGTFAASLSLNASGHTELDLAEADGDVKVTISAGGPSTFAGGGVTFTSEVVIDLGSGRAAHLGELGGSTRFDIHQPNNDGGIRIVASDDIDQGAALQIFGDDDGIYPGKVFVDSGTTDSGGIFLRTAGTGGTKTERLRVEPAGRVVIASPTTDTPVVAGAQLYVGDAGAGAAVVTIRDETNNVEGFTYVYSGGVILGAASNHALSLRTNNIDALVISTAQAIQTASHLAVVGILSAQVGTSGEFAQVGGVIESRTDDVGNAGGGEDDLHAFTLPANALANDGDSVEVIWTFTTVGHVSNLRQFWTYFGGNETYDSTAQITDPEDSGVIRMLVIRKDADEAKASVWMTNNVGSFLYYKYTPLSSLSFSSSNIIKVTGEGVNTNDIVITSSKIRYDRAAA